MYILCEIFRSFKTILETTAVLCVHKLGNLITGRMFLIVVMIINTNAKLVSLVEMKHGLLIVIWMFNICTKVMTKNFALIREILCYNNIDFQ